MASPSGDERAVGASERAYRSLLRAYPRELRDEYGDEMALCFRDLCREELEDRGGLGLAALWAHTLPELLYTALKERRSVLAGNTYRSVFGIALATAFILLIPLLAAPAWTLSDFVIAGALIFGTGLAYVLVARKGGNIANRFAVGVALAAAFLLVWINFAVGIIGEPDEGANLMYIGVLAVGIGRRLRRTVSAARNGARVDGDGVCSSVGRLDRADLRVGLGEPAGSPGDLDPEWVLRLAVCRICVVVPACREGAYSRGRRAGGLRALAAVVALALFTVGALDYPFGWGVRVAVPKPSS